MKLEKFVKYCILTKFPNETRNAVELRIIRFLHNAKDKNGGRAARQNAKSISIYDILFLQLLFKTITSKTKAIYNRGESLKIVLGPETS